MTHRLPQSVLPRPAPAAEPGPLDDRFYELVEERFVRLVRDNPILGTTIGLHQDDDLLGDGSREQVLGELAAERAHLTSIEGLDPAGLSSAVRFERDIEIHNLRRAIFDTDELRIWERRSFAHSSQRSTARGRFTRAPGRPVSSFGRRTTSRS